VKNLKFWSFINPLEREGWASDLVVTAGAFSQAFYESCFAASQIGAQFYNFAAG